MYDSLRKHGLSDTKNLLKQYMSGSSACQTSQRRNRAKKPLENTVKISKFDLGDAKDKEKRHSKQNSTALQLLIVMLSEKQDEKCWLNGHERSPLRFICLQQGCLCLGCSYCFLQRHSNHERRQIKECLQELKGLSQKVEGNRSESITLLRQKRQEICMQVRKEIQEIRQIFSRKLDELTNRIEEVIDRQFQDKMLQITMGVKKSTEKDIASLNSLTNLKGTGSNSSKVNTNMSCDEIVEMFNQKGSKKQLQKGQKQVKMGRAVSDFKLCESEEEQLIKRLSRLSTFKLNQFLRHQSQEIVELTSYLRVYQDFYSQLKTSLSQFFTTFNLAVPCFTSFEEGLTQPDILSAL